MSVELVFEAHSWSQENDRGVATGWLPGQLSERGRGLARELEKRRRSDRLAAAFTSDLRRAAETAALAFADSDLPVLADWRQRSNGTNHANHAEQASMIRRHVAWHNRQVHDQRLRRVGTRAETIKGGRLLAGR